MRSPVTAPLRLVQRTWAWLSNAGTEAPVAFTTPVTRRTRVPPLAMSTLPVLTSVRPLGSRLKLALMLVLTPPTV
ncbi:hypothetical protein D3C78_1845720 [compost metagenome]